MYFTTLWKGYFGWTKGMKQGWEFNQPLDNLPDNIKHITFITDKDSDNWSSFNQPLENLPSKLESLELMSCEFKQSLDYLTS